MGLVMLTGPAEEPVSVAEAKAHLRVSTAADDALIGSLIVAAREHVEARCRRALMTQVWDLYLDAFPAGEEIELAMPPLRAVESVTFFRDDGTSGTVAALDYVVDTASEPGRVRLVEGASWPSAELRVVNGFQVRFSAGYGGASAVPQGIKQALLLLVGALYENREEVIVAQGVSVGVLPFGVRALLSPFRVMRWL
jgi:uncharacterized phiE125 gp8 family phage protein